MDATDIETAGCDVGCDENGAGVICAGEFFDGAHAGFLDHLGVEGVGGDVEGLEHGC